LVSKGGRHKNREGGRGEIVGEGLKKTKKNGEGDEMSGGKPRAQASFQKIGLAKIKKFLIGFTRGKKEKPSNETKKTP